MPTPELVGKAYQALASGDNSEVRKYWDDNLVWLVPGHNPLSGRYHGLDAFLSFMAEVGKLSGNSFNMTPIAVMTSDEYSADVTRNVGYREGHEPELYPTHTGPNGGQVPYTKLDIDVVHVLKWKDDKVIEGKGAIFGDGTTQYDQFWGPLAFEGERDR